MKKPELLHYCLLNFFGQDDLWDAMEEYKEAKEMMLDIGRQILLKVYPKQSMVDNLAENQTTNSF